MKPVAFFLFLLLATGCVRHQVAGSFPKSSNNNTPGGTQFFSMAASLNWQQRDSLAILWFQQGWIPGFNKNFLRINLKSRDESGKRTKLSFWVSPDYFSVGNQHDWVRVPITPMASQQMMDAVNCVFPTRKMVDDIYTQAKVQLKPVPMYAFRDSGITMYQHHLMIEGQRKGRSGLIAGIKKDLVTTYKLEYGPRKNRVAIYGWHHPDGKPIQPLYLGHVNWYVDYSHGTRFVWNTVKVNGRKMLIQEALKQPIVQSLLCNEDTCGYFRY